MLLFYVCPDLKNSRIVPNDSDKAVERNECQRKSDGGDVGGTEQNFVNFYKRIQPTCLHYMLLEKMCNNRMCIAVRGGGVHSVQCIQKKIIDTEPVSVDLLRSPGIDSQPGRPVRQPFLSYRPARLHRMAESIPRNLFLGSINGYKYGLWRAEF